MFPIIQAIINGVGSFILISPVSLSVTSLLLSSKIEFSPVNASLTYNGALNKVQADAEIN
jgi:hypothetical protein